MEAQLTQEHLSEFTPRQLSDFADNALSSEPPRFDDAMCALLVATKHANEGLKSGDTQRGTEYRVSASTITSGINRHLQILQMRLGRNQRK